jgi:hypothetical protein
VVTALDVAYKAADVELDDKISDLDEAYKLADTAIKTSITNLTDYIEGQIKDLNQAIQGKDVVAADFTTLAALNSMIDAVNAVTGETSVTAKIAKAIGHPTTQADGEATGLWADIEGAIKSASDALQNNIDLANGRIDLLINDAVVTGSNPQAATLGSIAGLMAAINTLNGAGDDAGSVLNTIAGQIGHPTTVADGAAPVGSLWAQIEAYIANALDDVTPPMAPIVSLLHDNGTNTADGITNDGRLKVQGIESGAAVEYRVGPNPNPWTPTAPTATPGNNNIYVRQVDAAGNASEAAQIQFVLDVISPTVLSVNSAIPDGVYKAGVVVPFEVHFSEVINVTGSPVLTLDLYGANRQVTYSSGSGTDTLTFNYTVQPGDNSNCLDATLLELHGASVQDVAGNQAILTLNDVTLSGLDFDTNAPDAPVIDTVAGDDVFSDGIEGSGTGKQNMTITGQGEAGATITLVRTQTTAEVDIYGYWSMSVENAFSEFGQGAEVLVFTQTDVAGNVSQIGTHAISVHTGIQGSAGYLLSSDIKNTLSGMDDIHVYGETSFKDASSLMQVQNSGKTTFENIKLTYLQAATLPVDANDNILKITVTGLNFVGRSVLVDLSAFDASTEIWYTGGSADEAVMVSGSAVNAFGNGRYLFIDGGKGNDEVRIVEALNENGDGIDSKITGDLYGGLGNDTLTIVGQVDISGISTISGFETLQLLNGSPSKVTLKASQLAGFTSIVGSGGDDPSVVNVVGSDNLIAVDLTNLLSFEGVKSFTVGDKVELIMTAAQAALVTIDQVPGYSGQSFGGTLSLTGSLRSNLDLSGQKANIDLSGLTGFKVDAQGKLAVSIVDNENSTITYTITLPVFAANQKLIVAANQLVGENRLSANNLGELIVRGDFTEPGTVDLRGLSYTVNFDDEATDNSGFINTGVSVESDTILKANAQQLSGATVSGYGTVHLYNAKVNVDGQIAETGTDIALSLKNLSNDLHVIADIDSQAAILNDLNDMSRIDEIRLAEGVSLTVQEDSINGKTIVGDATNIFTVRDFTSGTSLTVTNSALQVIAEIRNTTDISNARDMGHVDAYQLVSVGAQGLRSLNTATLQNKFDAVTPPGELIEASYDFNASHFDLSAYAGQTVNLFLKGEVDGDVLFLLFSADGTLRGADSESTPNSYGATLNNITIQTGD